MPKNQLTTMIDKNVVKTVQLFIAATDQEGDPELFKKLLDQDEDYDVNYKIPDSQSILDTNCAAGSTIFQLVYNYSELSQLLIEQGADYLVANKNGDTVLLKAVSSWDGDYLSYSRGECGDETSYTNLILSTHINLKNPTNPMNRNGFSHFHVACMFNRVDAVKFFLDNGVPINETVNSDSKFYPGYSALHFAAKLCAFETADLLITSGANLFAKDSSGKTPLHVLIFDERKTFVQLNRMSRIDDNLDADNPEYSTLSNYYDKLHKLIYLLMKKMQNEYGYLDYNMNFHYIHVLSLLGGDANLSIAKEYFNSAYNKNSLACFVNMDARFWPGYTPLHFAAHTDVEKIELLLKEGADLCAKDANGLTPFDVCLKEFTVADVHKILLLIPDYASIIFSDGKTKLSDFIHAMEEPATFEHFLKSNITDINMFIPLDSPVCAGCTPLHLTIMCTEQPMYYSSENHELSYSLIADLTSEKSQIYLSRIDKCLSFNPDVTIRDARGSTPLHWAFKLQQSEAVYRLLERQETNLNVIDEHGLSHLHIAAAAGNEIVVESLLSGGANMNEVARSSYIWLKYEDRLEKCFISKGSTPLHFGSSGKQPQTVKILIAHGAEVLAQDIDGLNSLERMLKVPIFKDEKCSDHYKLVLDDLKKGCSMFNNNEKEIIQLLFRKIGDVLVNTKPKEMLYCYSLLHDVLLAAILSHKDKSAMKILANVGITALHVACLTRNLEQVNQLVGEIDVNASVDLESPLWPGYTPLHVFLKYRYGYGLDSIPPYTTIFEKLLEQGANVAALNAEGETPIHVSYFIEERYYSSKLFEYMKDFNINPMSKRGLTHLQVASAFSTPEIVEKLLKHGAVIDQATDYFMTKYGGFTALHFAAEYSRENIVDILLKYGANANWKNANGGNPLHTATKILDRPCRKILRTLISTGTDIHAIDMFGERSIESLIKWLNPTKEEIELFLESGCQVHIFNPMTNEGFLALAFNQKRQLSIFEMAIKTTDVREIDCKGRNAIHNVVSFKRPHWAHLEMIQEGDASYAYATSGKYIETIKSLMDLGLNINHQDCSGSTPLHYAARMQNLTGMIGLLENGADINIVDADGKPAFTYSLELALLHKEPKYHDLIILSVISTHILKLKLANAKIVMSNRAVDLVFCKKYPFNATYVETINTEIEKMKCEFINSTSVTLYDFLSDTGAVGVFPYMISCKQKAINDVFVNNVENVKKEFPEFASRLFVQYKKALARCEIIDYAVTSLNDLLGFNMPGICSKIILRFLDNEELNNLINAESL